MENCPGVDCPSYIRVLGEIKLVQQELEHLKEFNKEAAQNFKEGGKMFRDSAIALAQMTERLEAGSKKFIEHDEKIKTLEKRKIGNPPKKVIALSLGGTAAGGAALAKFVDFIVQSLK